MWQYFKYTWFFLIWFATVYLIFKFFTASYLKGRHSAQRGEFLIVFQPCSVSRIETLKCQWPRHTCKTKVSRERSKAEIPSRPSHRITLPPVVAGCKCAIKFMSLLWGLVEELPCVKKRGESQASLNHPSGEASPSLPQLLPQKWEESRLPTAIQTSSYFLRVPGTCPSIHNPQQVEGNRIIMNASADV